MRPSTPKVVARPPSMIGSDKKKATPPTRLSTPHTNPTFAGLLLPSRVSRSSSDEDKQQDAEHQDGGKQYPCLGIGCQMGHPPPEPRSAGEKPDGDRRHDRADPQWLLVPVSIRHVSEAYGKVPSHTSTGAQSFLVSAPCPDSRDGDGSEGKREPRGVDRVSDEGVPTHFVLDHCEAKEHDGRQGQASRRSEPGRYKSFLCSPREIGGRTGGGSRQNAQ